MHRRQLLSKLVLLCVATLLIAPLYAHAPSGAIFTTLADGTEVNFNIFPSKEAVYLDGGPGPGAPQHAAGLDDGVYVFQITDPSGKVLLSTDRAECRRFNVSGGVITSVVATGGCEHEIGADVDHPPAITVQMMPYNDTPNPGGVYKAWVVRENDFLNGCAALGVPNGLEVVDCGYVGGNFHGFVPAHTKTDNFKVRSEQSAEIDVQFFTPTRQQLSGRHIDWTDTLGSTNRKHSYVVYFGSVIVAHVEAVEDGYHKINIPNQIGCTVGEVRQNGKLLRNQGPQSVEVRINNGTKNNGIYYYTVNLEVTCIDQ